MICGGHAVRERRKAKMVKMGKGCHLRPMRIVSGHGFSRDPHPPFGHPLPLGKGLGVRVMLAAEARLQGLNALKRSRSL